MAELTVQPIIITGLEWTTASAAGGGDSFSNDENTFFYVANGSGGDITVTFDDTGSVSPTGATAFTPDVAVVVTAAESRMIGPFPKARFGSSVGITYSGVTSLTVAAIKLPRV